MNSISKTTPPPTTTTPYFVACRRGRGWEKVGQQRLCCNLADRRGQMSSSHAVWLQTNGAPPVQNSLDAPRAEACIVKMLRSAATGRPNLKEHQCKQSLMHKWSNWDQVGWMEGQDLNMRLAVASWELLVIGHEHQSVHRHVSAAAQLLSHRAFSVHCYETAILLAEPE